MLGRGRQLEQEIRKKSVTKRRLQWLLKLFSEKRLFFSENMRRTRKGVKERDEGLIKGL